MEGAPEDEVIVTVKKPTATPASTPAPSASNGEMKVTVRAPTKSAREPNYVDVSTTEDDGSMTSSVTVRKPAASEGTAAPVASADNDLVEAARTSNIREIKRALDRGADPNAADAQGFSAMHLCAATGLAPGIVSLAKAGANMDYVAQNLTALTMAIGYNKPFTLETIVKCGADTTMRDADGLTPEEFIATLRQKEKDDNAEEEETFFVKKVNKRIEALDKMKEALKLAGSEGKLAKEEAQKNIEEMYAELKRILKW